MYPIIAEIQAAINTIPLRAQAKIASACAMHLIEKISPSGFLSQQPAFHIIRAATTAASQIASETGQGRLESLLATVLALNIGTEPWNPNDSNLIHSTEFYNDKSLNRFISNISRKTDRKSWPQERKEDETNDEWEEDKVIKKHKERKANNKQRNKGEANEGEANEEQEKRRNLELDILNSFYSRNDEAALRCAEKIYYHVAIRSTPITAASLLIHDYCRTIAVSAAKAARKEYIATRNEALHFNQKFYDNFSTEDTNKRDIDARRLGATLEREIELLEKFISLYIENLISSIAFAPIIESLIYELLICAISNKIAGTVLSLSTQIAGSKAANSPTLGLDYASVIEAATTTIGEHLPSVALNNGRSYVDIEIQMAISEASPVSQKSSSEIIERCWRLYRKSWLEDSKQRANFDSIVAKAEREISHQITTILTDLIESTPGAANEALLTYPFTGWRLAPG